MKISTVALVISTALWVFWVFPLHGKQLAPEVFGTPAIQFSAAIVVALLIPVAVLIGLRMVFNNERKIGLAVVVFAVIPLLTNLAIYGVGGVFLARTNIELARMDDNDLAIVDRLTEQALISEDVEKRRAAAGTLISCYGVLGVWRDSEGVLNRYEPELEELNRWEDSLDSFSAVSSTAEMLDQQLRQLPWLFGLNLGTFVLVMFLGLLWESYKQKCDQADTPSR